MITYDKTLTKNLLAVRPENCVEKEKKTPKNRKVIARLFALNTNAIMNLFLIIPASPVITQLSKVAADEIEFNNKAFS